MTWEEENDYKGKKEKQQILTRKSMKNTSTAENGNVNKWGRR